MHLKREFLSCFALVMLIFSTLACTGGETELPTVLPSQEPTSESVTTPDIVVTSFPTSTPNSDLIIETRVFPEEGFSIYFFVVWREERTLDEIILTDPINPLNRLIIQKLQSQYSLSWVDEQISESLLEAITEEYPDISASMVYPAQLGSITNARAFDYVIYKGGEKVYGGLTIGTQNYGETWVVKWEIADSDYANLSYHFLDALESFIPLMD